MDCNREMIALARRYPEEVASRIGFANVEFRYGLIQDLALDLEQLAEETRGLTIEAPQDWLNVRRLEQRLRHESPMIPDDSVDCVVSNCVLNLVRPEDRPCFVLTNGTKPLRNRMARIVKLKEKPNSLAFRVSLDHPDPVKHDESRGKGNFRMALRTLVGQRHFCYVLSGAVQLGLLQAEGFGVSIARLMEPGEDVEVVDKSYAPLLAEAGLPEDRLIVKFPDFLKPGSIADVPEVTENCMTSYTTAAQRAQYMCSFSRMIVKMNGRCGVYACTLVDDDGEFDLGDTLTESLDARIRLKHHRCYSCFGCGSTCSEGTPA